MILNTIKSIEKNEVSKQKEQLTLHDKEFYMVTETNSMQHIFSSKNKKACLGVIGKIRSAQMNANSKELSKTYRILKASILLH